VDAFRTCAGRAEDLGIRKLTLELDRFLDRVDHLQDMYRKRKDPPHVVREEWIIDSVAKNRLLDVGAYLLMSSNSSLAMSNFLSLTVSHRT